MFISNCPCPNLALTFRTKTIKNWTAREVQEVLDEYHTNVVSPTGTQGLRQRQCVAVLDEYTQPKPVECYAQYSAAEAREVSREVTAGVGEPDGQQQLKQVITLLERLLQKTPPLATATPSVPACAVCASKTHSTRAHCQRGNLCFRCFAVGHQAGMCPVVSRPVAGAQSDAPQQQPLN